MVLCCAVLCCAVALWHAVLCCAVLFALVLLLHCESQARCCESGGFDSVVCFWYNFADLVVSVCICIAPLDVEVPHVALMLVALMFQGWLLLFIMHLVHRQSVCGMCAVRVWPVCSLCAICVRPYVWQK